MHEATVNTFKIEESNLTFDDIYNEPYFPNDISGIKEANLLLIPDKDPRPNTGFTFPETTDEFFSYLKENAPSELKTDIAISDENYKKFNMHSDLVPVVTMICKIAVLPIVTGIIANFLYDLAKQYLKKEEDLSAKIDLYVQNGENKSMRIQYLGPVKGIQETLEQGVKAIENI